jgi:outer membrane lipoprotein-sorting protein
MHTLHEHTRIWAVIVAMCLAPAATFAQSVAGDANYLAILEEIDRSQNFNNTDFSASFTFVSEKPDEETSVFKARMFRRDLEDKFVLVFMEPQIQQGQGYLQVDENLWFYDPESRKFTHSSLRENLEDSEARNSDLRASTLAQDYSVRGAELGTLGRYSVHVIELDAVHDEVSYPGLKVWVRTDNNLVLKVENYSLSGRLMRSDYYPNYVQVEDRFIASRVLLVDELRPGERTQMTLTDTSLARLPDSVFTKSYLERVNR